MNKKVYYFLLFFSCGIPDISYISPPISSDAGYNNFYLITALQEEKYDYLGIELYYKFYDPLEVRYDYNFDLNYLESKSRNILSYLKSRNYFRLNSNKDNQNIKIKPLIRLNLNEQAKNISFNVDFSFSNGEPFINNLFLYREFDILGNIKSFNDIQIDDEDLELDSLLNGISIGIIALTYAFKELKEYYSEPAFLGYINII